MKIEGCNHGCRELSNNVLYETGSPNFLTKMFPFRCGVTVTWKPERVVWMFLQLHCKFRTKLVVPYFLQHKNIITVPIPIAQKVDSGMYGIEDSRD